MVTTIRDVARAAGVSIATVSRVFNGGSRVEEQTAHRVWTAAAELDYWPNSAARSLTTNRTHALGVLLPDLHGEFFSEVIRGIDQAARQENFQVLISSPHANSDEVVSAARAMRGRIDGLVIMASDTGTAAAVEQISQSFPVVLLNPCREVAASMVVSLANYTGAQAAATHLLNLGHQAIAMVKGPAGNVDAEERLRGYRQAMIAAGMTDTAALEIQGDFTELSGHHTASELLGHPLQPTAVFAANDCMAVGLLSALHQAGCGVPGDMAVVGFDDIAMAQYLNPPLTTVHVDTYELGRRAVQLLISDLRSFATGTDGRESRQETIPATLVLRSSCGATQHREQKVH